MKIRFGFVANALELWDASPSKTVTFKRYQQLGEKEGQEKLLEVTSLNLQHTKRILYYLAAHEIPLYRFSSSLVPLATHPEVAWDFITPFREEWAELGRLVRQFSIRPSFHPNQFTLFTSSRQQVTDNAVGGMQFHYDMLKAMSIEEQAVVNIHIGGSYGDKNGTLVRFYDNLQLLPKEVKDVMTLENDDKTYNVEETLTVCQEENIPMVLDIHHHVANPTAGPIEDYIADIFATWQHRKLIPKVHISSPKSDNAFRAHADYVDARFIEGFFAALRKFDTDVDFMIEAKSKDLAMRQLIEDLSSIRGVKRIGGGTLMM
ncbi:UV DNA damage repair endonuclease UvsE [Bacillus sp. 2205SS5-2]|uniref:UV DNA damage repair endonuclease UvsE n=1 Tax=Bacillus sp. 2205SS5-2 TaxID=3109031 RepID=UPI003004D8A9